MARAAEALLMRNLERFAVLLCGRGLPIEMFHEAHVLRSSEPLGKLEKFGLRGFQKGSLPFGTLHRGVWLTSHCVCWDFTVPTEVMT